MSSASSVVRPDDITVVAHGQGSIVRCRRTRRTLVLGPRETRFIAACSRPRHVEDLKIEVGSDFTGHDVEKLIVLFRDFGVLRYNDTPSAHQRLWSFRLLTIRMSGTCQHPRLLRVLADTISAGGALSVIVSVWLITCHAPQVVHDLINQRYISMSSLIHPFGGTRRISPRIKPCHCDQRSWRARFRSWIPPYVRYSLFLHRRVGYCNDPFAPRTPSGMERRAECAGYLAGNILTFHRL